MRIIKIRGNINSIKESKKIINIIKKDLDKRNVLIKFIPENKNFKAELIGYDGKIKSVTTKIDKIPLFLEKIDQMPMGSQEKKLRKENFQGGSLSREKLLDKCGLPNNSNTSHCFADSTHHTCCILGPKARAYADSSGNPIGITSENAFENRYGRKVKKNEKTSWCTCTGSKVCSYYQKKFPNDGTYIKFIGNTNTKNEDEGIKKMNIMRHRTPGVN